MEPEHIDGGLPLRKTPEDLQLARPGPAPMEDDSWDASAVWLSSDASAGGSDRYRGRRRTNGTRSDYRWWIGGAAALIASVATVALIMAPSSGAGGPGTSSGPSWETAGPDTTTAAELPIGDGSAPVGMPSGDPSTTRPPFAVTIEAESGSPAVILAGSAVVESDDRASGGQIVTKLGNSGDGTQPGTIQINGISLPSSGEYRISIHYANLDVTGHSSAVVAVTGTEPTTINFMGSKRCCGVRTIDVTLAAGAHGLTITNATGVAPSIDRIVVSRA